MTTKDVLPPLLIVVALLVWATGIADRAGLVGAGEGLLIGAAVCTPIWLFGLYRRAREKRRDGA